MNRIDKEVKTRIYIITVLATLIVIGLLYLFASGSFDRIRQKIQHKDNPQEVDVNMSQEDNPEETQDPKPTATPTPTPTATVTPTPTPEVKVDVDDDESIQRVVNPSRLVDQNYVPKDLTTMDVPQYGTQRLRKEAAEAVEEMFAEAKKDGIDLFLVSAYRSYDEQVSLYNTYLANSSEEAMQMSDSVPGGTEHQLGLAIDLGDTSQVCELDGCFESTKTYEWLKENSYRFGFLERHPKGKEKYTKINFNPWSFRYIGKEEAKKIYESKKAIEEYYELD